MIGKKYLSLKPSVVTTAALAKVLYFRVMKHKRSKSLARYGTLLFCTLLLVTGCSDGKNKSKASGRSHKKKIALVTAVKAKRSEILQTIALNGTVVPYRLARLASPAEGPVLKLRAREGDKVSVGRSLLAIGRRSGVKALIVSLSEELQKEEDNLNRTQRLVQDKALPGEDLDKAKASFEKVKSRLASAQQSERDYQIVAPFSGVLSRLLVSEGDFVAPRKVLAEMYDPATLVLRATVNERHAALLKMGMKAEVSLDAYPKQRFSGRISRLYPYLDERARTRSLEISINEPVDLLPGMFGRIRLVIKSIPDALVIPVNALLVTPQGGSIVYVDQDGKAVQRKVTTGIEDRDRLQLLSGVKAGELVIVSGNEKLKDGRKIRLLGAKGHKKSRGTAASPVQKKLQQERSGNR